MNALRKAAEWAMDALEAFLAWVGRMFR